MKFVKMHGAGNDYVYINGFETKVDKPEELAPLVSDRHKGIGSDGLVLILPSEVAEVRMRMFNRDGSEAQMCGNAIRCVGKFAYTHGLVKTTKFNIETMAGIKEIVLHLENEQVVAATVDMGTPIFKSKDIPVKVNDEICLNQSIEIDGKMFAFSCASMGNPHAVIIVDDVENFEVEKFGSQIEVHKLFPEKVNVEFVQIIDKSKVRMRVWERGSGETEACGTGACATAVLCAKLGYCDRKVEVVLNGGSLEIDWRENDHIFMTGGATQVFSGDFYVN